MRCYFVRLVVFAEIIVDMSVGAENNELVARGSHCELALRPMENCFSGPSSELESVVYYAAGLDDKGLHRTIRNISVPTVTVYRPIRSAGCNAAFVICPGGAYGAVVIDREGHAIARYFQEQGFTVAVLKYRLPSSETFAGGLPVSQRDALAAVRFMRAHADDWGIDRSRIGIMGFSAGGHLAGSTAVFGGKEDRPDFVAMLYPVVTMGDPCAHAGSRTHLIGSAPSAERVVEFSLEQRVQAGMPPFFIVHAKDDTAVSYQNSVLLANALEAAHVPVTLLLVNEGGHGFTLGRGPESSGWKNQFLSWLDEAAGAGDVSLRKLD